MRGAQFAADGSCIRWTEMAGTGTTGEAKPSRVYVHGLGAASAPYFVHIAAHPALAGRRSLLVDLPGFGISDRPADFGYTLTDHADALATALDTAGVTGTEVIGHSMGGSVAIVLAARRPDLVSRLVLGEANLDPDPPVTAGSSVIASYGEDDFVHGGGFAVEFFGSVWRATLRLADPVALHRSATGLVRGTRPTMRELLLGLTIPRTYLVGALSEDMEGREEMAASGVRVPTVLRAGHNLMFNNPEAFVRAVAAEDGEPVG